MDLCVHPGEFVCFIGPNASGKTTLARHLNGLLLPTTGSLLVDQLDPTDPQQLHQVRRRVGMVFQNPDSQMVAPTVEQEIAFGPENLGLDSHELRRRVDWATGALGLGELLGCDPHLLSGGQRQKVALAAVLAMEPCYLVLDEPTTMLDGEGRRLVLDAIARLHRRGLAIVLVTHRPEEVALADRLVVLDSGRVLHDGPPEHLCGQSAGFSGGTDTLSALRAAFISPLAALTERLRARKLLFPAEQTGFLDRLEAMRP